MHRRAGALVQRHNLAYYFRSKFHPPMAQRRYVTTAPGLLLCYGHHDNQSFPKIRNWGGAAIFKGCHHADA